MTQENKEELKRIMKEVDELTAHQQNGTPHRLRGEQFIEYIKTLLKDIETISASFIEDTEKKNFTIAKFINW